MCVWGGGGGGVGGLAAREKRYFLLIENLLSIALLKRIIMIDLCKKKIPIYQ